MTMGNGVLAHAEREERVAKAKELYESGQSIESIAADLDVTIGTVKSYLRYVPGRVETTMFWKRKQAAERRKKIEELYREGYLLSEIAEKLEITKGCVNVILCELRDNGTFDDLPTDDGRSTWEKNFVAEWESAVNTLKHPNNFKECIHSEKRYGKIIVYVRHSCQRKNLFNGKWISTKKRCINCKKFEHQSLNR